VSFTTTSQTWVEVPGMGVKVRVEGGAVYVEKLDVLDVECPYTSCSAPPGETCTNARNGEPLAHGHPERRRAAKGK
jgi:hypothetical protein